MLQHAGVVPRPQTRAVVVPDRQPDAGDVAIANRLLSAYRMASRAGGSSAHSSRETSGATLPGASSASPSILARGDAEEVALYLGNVSRHDASEGITQGSGEFKRIVHDPAHRDFVALMVKDKLVSLAEAVGRCRPRTPSRARTA
jgi:hypothetical protein